MYVTRYGKKLMYLSRRVNGKPRKIYLGTGPLAELAALELEARRSERKAKAEERAARKARPLAAEHSLDSLCAGLELFTTASLLAEGFHRQDRHDWRKRREYRSIQTQ